MSDTVTGLLGRAMEAFERHEHEEVLQLLLEAWGQTRSERLAGLAERLSAMAIPGAIPPEGPLGLLRRLAALVEKAGTGDSWGVGSGLGECQARPPDPRLTPALLDLAALPVADKAEVCLRLCNLLGHVGDPRSLGPLRALHAGLLPGSRLERRLGAVIERVAGQPVMALEAESSSLCDVLEEAIARRAESMARSRSIREALHARILEHPDDDGARLVLADHLQEVGDPLGELIALQCAPQPDADRIAEVLQQHRPTWEALLGPGVMPGETRFVRGFPHAVRMKVEPGQRLPPPGPFWCTMREIDWCWTGDEEEADWLAHPHLGGVTVLWQVSHAMARRLGQHRLPVRRLELCINVRREPREVLTSLESLPHLSQVELVCGKHGFEVPLLMASPLVPRLDHFEATRLRHWSLRVAPKAEVPVEVSLLSAGHAVYLPRLIRDAARLGITRALRVHVRCQLRESIRSRLEEAASAFARVEWDVLPG